MEGRAYIVNSLVEKYLNEITPIMSKKFNYDSVMEIPKIDKIILNMDAGNTVSNTKNLDETVEKLALIPSQKPLIAEAKKSITNFRLHEGMSVGAKITLRGDRVYDFLYKLISVFLPRVCDLHGISSRSFDGRGNCTLDIKEQLIFPKVDYDKVSRIRGLDVVIIATAGTDEGAHELLTKFGMPLAKRFGGH